MANKANAIAFEQMLNAFYSDASNLKFERTPKQTYRCKVRHELRLRKQAAFPEKPLKKVFVN